MTDQKKTKKAFIISGFRDAGTEQEFTGGKVEDIDEGQFLNYEAAGLVRTPTADELKAAKAATDAPAA